MIPICDHILRNQPERKQARAIIVYPMNALINSQFEALKAHAAIVPAFPLRFEKYTGQEKDETRQRILDDPPVRQNLSVVKYSPLDALLCSISIENETCCCGVLDGKIDRLVLLPNFPEESDCWTKL